MEGKFHVFLPANASSCEKNEQRKIFRYLDDGGGKWEFEKLLPEKSFSARCGKLCWSLNIDAEILSVSDLTLKSFHNFADFSESFCKVSTVTKVKNSLRNFLWLFNPSDQYDNWVFLLWYCVDVFWVFPFPSTSIHHWKRRHFNLFCAEIKID